MSKNMLLRVAMFTLGAATVCFGIYLALEPIGRVMAAVGGICLAAAGVLLCTFVALADSSSNKVNY